MIAGFMMFGVQEKGLEVDTTQRQRQAWYEVEEIHSEHIYI